MNTKFETKIKGNIKNIVKRAIFRLIIMIVGISLIYPAGAMAVSAVPVISSVQAVNIMHSGGQIKWNTDIPASSSVSYGTSSGTYGQSSSSGCSGDALNTSHCVNLTGLAFETVYYYTVVSVGEMGQKTSSQEYRFTSGSSMTSSDSKNYSSSSSSSTTPPPAGTPPPPSYTPPPPPSTATTYTSPLSAPSNLAIVLAANGIDANFSWTDNSNNEKYFKIFSRPPSGTWTYLTQVPTDTATFTYYNHPTGSYEYYILACDDSGCSGTSNTITFSIAGGLGNPPPPAPPPPPGTPPPPPSTATTYTSPLSAPSNLAIVLAANGIDANFSWTDNSNNEKYFKIFSRPPSGTWTYLTQVPTDTATFTYYNYPTGSYEYYVLACDSSGCSPTSNTVAFSKGTRSVSPPPPLTSTSTATSTFYVDPSQTFPAKGGTNVSLSQSIQVRFNNQLDPASTQAQFFSLIASASPTSTIPGSFRMFSRGFDFTPAQNPLPNTTYIYTVFTTLKDINGQNLSSQFQASFTTGGSSGVGGSGTATGQINDASGAGVAGAWYHIYKPDYSRSFTGTADTSGVFQISLPADTYVIEIYRSMVRADLLPPVPLTFSIAAGETKKLSVAFVSPSKILSGKISFSDGRAAADAMVGAYSQRSGQWTGGPVDSSGNYSLALAGGKWQIGVRPQNPDTASWSFEGVFTEIEFASDGSKESKTINFSIPTADSTLIVQSVDETGKPIPSAGIMVDSFSATKGTVGFRSPPDFKKTDAKGDAIFSLRPGTYYVRGFFLGIHGYLDPQEQSVELGKKDSKTVQLVFRKSSAASTVTVKGVTRLEDGSATDAFVWGWSEKGGSASARSDASGSFSFTVTPDDRWHIGAGKEKEGFPYEANEVVVDIARINAAVELVLFKHSDIALPPAVSVSQNSSQQINAQARDGAGVTLPPQAVAAAGLVNVELKPTVEAPSQAAAQLVGTVYDLTIKDAGGNQVTTLTDEAEIVLPYNEEELKAKGISEGDVVPSFFEESTGTWVAVEDYTIDREKNLVIARVKHLTRFALVAAADVTPPSSPSDVAAVPLGVGGVRISWKNPGNDFNNAKVYRAESTGSLGKLVSSSVKGQEFTDNNVVLGLTYYYTVRAVDPAGNESNNKDQVAVLALASGIATAPPPPPLPPAVPSGFQFGRNLRLGSRGDDVRALQELLVREGAYPQKIITGYFGALTRRAVVRFQEKYGAEILAPAKRKWGTGIVDERTRAKLNERNSA